MTDHLLLVNRIQHTLHGSFDIFDCLIDYSVKSDIYAFSFRNGLRHGIRTYIKSDDDR